MTAFDRVERHLPELFDELAAAGIPDYFDDMLRTTTQARQRPAWSSLERWLPMGVIARPLPVRPMPWRIFAIIAMIGLLAAAALLYVGSAQRRVPGPFGPAANGSLAIATADGDIVTVDPTTGRTTQLIAGPSIDGGPYFSNDGLRLVFERGPTPETQALWIANADGTDAHLLTSRPITGFEWVPNSDRALIVSNEAGKGALSTINLLDGSEKAIPLDFNVRSTSWRPNHEQFIVTAEDSAAPVSHVTFWVMSADGTATPRKIDAAANAINDPTISADGKLLAYATWDPGDIHVVDIDTGGDRAITYSAVTESTWQVPLFSPDGRHIVAYQYVGNDGTARLGAVATDGPWSPVDLGPVSANPQPAVVFSPDATSLLATYPTLQKGYMFDMATGTGHEVPFLAINGSSWQRRAP